MNKEQIEAIITANEYMNNLIPAVRRFSKEMQNGKEKEVIGDLPLIADGLEYIFNVVRLTDNVSGEVNNIESLNEYFGEVVDALENDDYILIGDLFNYEILPILEEIKSILSNVSSN